MEFGADSALSQLSSSLGTRGALREGSSAKLCRKVSLKSRRLALNGAGGQR